MGDILSLILAERDFWERHGIYCIAVLLYVVVAIRASDILERIKKDKKLMGALDSEIYSDYNSKALTAGFYAAMQMGLLVYCFGDFFNLSVRMGALVIVVVAMLSQK